MPRRIVIALGGNAISSGDSSGDIPSQFDASRHTAKYIADLICAGHHVLMTHGNGPQVGMVLRRVELSRHEVYPIDLTLGVADTQAGMGYMICQCIRNEMAKRDVPVNACTIVTTVEVDPHDLAFTNPTKPIGQFYDEATARSRVETDGWDIKEADGKGWRRVVPSPKPVSIREQELIKHLFDQGRVVVCCGGGGIPVVRLEDGTYEGVEAVIDKDLTATELALGANADTLAILTAVEKVCLNFGTDEEQPLDVMTIAEAKKHLADKQFPPGTMGPKIEACIRFIERSAEPDAMAIITSIEGCTDALAGNTGTRIVK